MAAMLVGYRPAVRHPASPNARLDALKELNKPYTTSGLGCPFRPHTKRVGAWHLNMSRLLHANLVSNYSNSKVSRIP